MSRKRLSSIYNRLIKTFGPRDWWPAESSFEVMVGAILTQNTSWGNVEKAINNLKKTKALSVVKLRRINSRRLKSLIKPAGFYNVKAKRLKNFLNYLKRYKDNTKILKKKRLYSLRKELLMLKGIGPETADSILLYALNKPIFVIDAYTKRIFSRHKLINRKDNYDDLQKFFMQNLPRNYRLFNEYHALIVELGKRFCRAKRPLCKICPLKDI